MFRIHFASSLKREYLEPTLCSHDLDLHSLLLRPYKAEKNDRVNWPQ